MSLTIDNDLEARNILDVGFADIQNPYAQNLRSKLVVLSYLRIAQEIHRYLPASPTFQPKILDWGAGAGQMGYLLARRNFDVIGFSYLGTGSPVAHTTQQFAELQLPLVTSSEPVKLPFPDAHFEAVLSCGVLEHVSDEMGSLDEIRRILKPGGYLFIYQLPQKGSWLEFVIERLKLGYTHERKYTAQSVQQLLLATGFGVQTWRRANMLPKSFTGMPVVLKQAFEKQPHLVLASDAALARVPLLNQIGGVLELIAFKL